MKSIRALVQGFLSRHDQEDGVLLTRLWTQWEDVVGPELAEMASPMGHRENKLVLGAEDSMIIQEVTYLAPEILSSVNAFLGRNFFDKISVELIRGRTPLDSIQMEKKIGSLPFKRPDMIGGLLPWMQDDTPVARCYRRYAHLFGSSEEKNRDG
ncbi:MAG: DUF721 domain-containing protein [Desulfovibrionales bacterium]